MSLVKEWINEQHLGITAFIIWEEMKPPVSLFIKCWSIFQDRRHSLHLSQGHPRGSSRDPSWLWRGEKSRVSVRQAAVTKAADTYCSSGGCLRSRGRQRWLSLKPLSLPCRQLFSPVSSHGLTSVHVSVLITSFNKDSAGYWCPL